jgi:hypothetical protein
MTHPTTTELTDLARELGLNPRDAADRQRLRRAIQRLRRFAAAWDEDAMDAFCASWDEAAATNAIQVHP